MDKFKSQLTKTITKINDKYILRTGYITKPAYQKNFIDSFLLLAKKRF